jgi:hypothetical protein
MNTDNLTTRPWRRPSTRYCAPSRPLARNGETAEGDRLFKD